MPAQKIPPMPPKRHRTIRLRRIVFGAVLLVGALSACGGKAANSTQSTTGRKSGSTSTTNTTVAPTTTTAGPPSSAALTAATSAVGNELGAAAVVSAVAPDSGSYYLAAAFNVPADQSGVAEVHIYKYVGSTFVAQATVPLSADGGVGQITPLGSGYSGPLAVVSLTGSAAPDFFVPTAGASTSWGSVVSFLNGSWGAVPFTTSSGPAIGVPNASISGSQVASQVASCSPDCATGGYTDEYWAFNSATGTFHPSNGSSVTTPTTVAPVVATTTAVPSATGSQCSQSDLKLALDNSTLTNGGGPVVIFHDTCSEGYAEVTMAQVADTLNTAVSYLRQVGSSWTVITVGGYFPVGVPIDGVPQAIRLILDAALAAQH